MLFVLSACKSAKQAEPVKQPSSPTISATESRLIFNNLSLEQTNSQGQTLWKIQAERAVYSQDKKTAQLEELSGNLYQDGKIIVKVSANKGRVERNGETVWLEEQIIAIDRRNKVVIECQEAEWRPQENLLMVRDQLQASHDKMKASAKEGKYFTKQERLELIGKIVALGTDPTLRIKTEHLFWKIPQEKLIGDKPLELERYQGKTITDRLRADRGEVELNNKIARLDGNVELNSLKPPLQVATNSATWNLDRRIVNTDQPIQIIDREEQLTITANQGKFDLEKRIAYLRDGVRGESQRNQSQIYSNQLTWNSNTKMVEAEGNVIYQQAEPKFYATGDKAVGNLEDNSIVVTSKQGKRVFTEIIPENGAN